MAANLSNQEELVFPILLPTSGALEKTSFFYISYSLECLTIIFATPALVIFYRTLDRSSLFHRNLVIITKYHYCMLYMALPSRITIILYAVRIIDVSGVVGVDKVVINALGIFAIASTAHVILFRRERRRLTDFIVGPQTGRYLSTRFQIIENLRVLKIVMFACVIISIWALTPSALLVMVFYYFLPTTLTGQKLAASVELFFSSFVKILLVGSAAMLKRYIKRVHTLDRFQRENRLHYENRDCRLVTEKYFGHLKSAWG